MSSEIAQNDGISPESLSEKLINKEKAVHQVRHWVRVTAVCNNRCTFCLDSDLQDGTFLSWEEVTREIDRGRKEKGANRIILSGGEASIHKRFPEFIKYAKDTGYEWVQTVTNGRMYSKPEFADKVTAAGLDEATFSIHGHTTELHDRLVQAKGALVQLLKGAVNLKDRGLVVSADIVINKQNFKHVEDIINVMKAIGVFEFDLLQVTPFGRAFHDQYKDDLFYDLNEGYPYLRKAFAHSQDPRVYMWTNRFPVNYLEGFEDLIQDPHKLLDETNGRRDFFDDYTHHGTPPPCYGDRCPHCFLENLCGTLFERKWDYEQHNYTALRIDVRDKVQLRVMDNGALHEKVERVILAGDEGGQLEEILGEIGERKVTLELESYAACPPHVLSRADRVVAKTAGDLALLAPLAGFELHALLTRSTQPWIDAHIDELKAHAGGFSVIQPTFETLTETAAATADLETLGPWAKETPIAGPPPCFGGADPAKAGPDKSVLEAAMIGADGRIEIFRYVHWYIANGYLAKSRRCTTCAYNDTCPGMHINYLRHHGFKALQPVRSENAKLEGVPQKREKVGPWGPGTHTARTGQHGPATGMSGVRDPRLAGVQVQNCGSMHGMGGGEEKPAVGRFRVVNS